MRDAAPRKVPGATSADTLRWTGGNRPRKSYFACPLPHARQGMFPRRCAPLGQTKHPPRVLYTYLLSFGMPWLQSLVHRSLVAVKLEPAFGFFHQPRLRAHPLVLDVMELFHASL